MNIITSQSKDSFGFTKKISVLFENYEPDVVFLFKKKFHYFKVHKASEDVLVFSCCFEKESSATIALENIYQFKSRCSDICSKHEEFFPRNFSHSEIDLLSSQLSSILRRFDSLKLETCDLESRLRGFSSSDAACLRDQSINEIAEIEERLKNIRARLLCLSFCEKA